MLYTGDIAIYIYLAFSIIFWVVQALSSFVVYLLYQQKFKWPKLYFKCSRKDIYKCCKTECLEKFKIKYIKGFLENNRALILQLMEFFFISIFWGASIYHTATNTAFNKHFWRIGIFAVIFGWTYFIILVSKFPSLGEYSLIFISILETFLSLAMFGFVLILASTLVLRMLFYNPLELAS